MLQDDSPQTNKCRTFVWDKHLDDRLLHLRDQGYSYPRISELMGCPSQDVIRRRYHRLIEHEVLEPVCIPPDVKNKFKELYLQTPPISMSSIAEIMGRTKNSVCGLRRRMGLPPRPRCAERDKKNPYGAPRKTRQDGKPLAPRKIPDAGDHNAALANLKAATEQGFLSGGKSFDELGSRDCRFIDGDPKAGGHRFCGVRAVNGKSWCAQHYRVVFRDLR